MYDNEFYYNEENNNFYTSKEGISYEEVFNSIENIDSNWIYHRINGKYVTISKNSKIIYFIKGEEIKSIFIVNSYQVLFLLDKFGFKYYKIDGKDSKEINIDDNLNFNEIKYLDNLLFETDFEKANENIKEKQIVLLENLSLMYYDYQKIKEKSEFILTEQRQKFFEKLNNLNKERKFIPICGPKFIGKTTSLLYYLKRYARFKYFYINLNYCKKLLSEGEKEKLYLCICKELFNCMPFEEILKIYDFIKNKNNNNIMDLVLDIMKYMKKKFPFNKCYIVLDQYKEKIDNSYSVIKQIKNMAENNSKFNILVCSSINEFDLRNSLNKILGNNSDEFYLNYLFINELISVEKDKSEIQLNEKEIDLLNESGNLFYYFYFIRENKIIQEKSCDKTKNEILERIAEDINGYFNENDNKKKMEIIRTIHENIYKNIKFCDLKSKLSLFPFRYFNLLIKDKDMFIIEELKKDTEIYIKPSYPIVIDCINQIFQSSKYELKKNSSNEITTNTDKAKKSSELEESFNEYLWFYRNNYFFKGCKIVEKIQISSLIDMNESDGKIIKKAAEKITIINDSILITQTFQNAKHYDTAILKLISFEKDEKIFELYLFQETLKKNSNERLLNATLNEDKICLKYQFYLLSFLKIDNIYFNYVFDKNNLDTATINYCKETNISYLIYDDSSLTLDDCEINPIIMPKFEFPMASGKNSKNLKNEYSLEVVDINYSDIKENLEKQKNNLNNVLNKKRKLIREKPEDLSNKIEALKKYVNNELRNNEIEDNVIQDYLMDKEKEKIVGLSFKIDNETKKILKDLNFKKTELKNLYSFMKYYSDNPGILKIIELEKGFVSVDIPNYDCCILQVDSNNNKLFFDINKENIYQLKDKSKINHNLEGNYYLIKFINKNMISD